jgi:hypothetical protein
MIYIPTLNKIDLCSSPISILTPKKFSRNSKGHNLVEVGERHVVAGVIEELARGRGGIEGAGLTQQFGKEVGHRGAGNHGPIIQTTGPPR